MHRSRNSVVVFLARKSCIRCAELWSERCCCNDLSKYVFWTCWFIIVSTPESDAILKNEGDLIAHSFRWSLIVVVATTEWMTLAHNHNYWLVHMNNYFLILALEATLHRDKATGSRVQVVKEKLTVLNSVKQYSLIVILLLLILI